MNTGFSLAAGFSLLLCWVLMTRATGVLFPGVERTAVCCQFHLFAALEFLLCAGAGGFLPLDSKARGAIRAVAGSTCGFAGTVLAAVPSFAGMPSVAAALVMGALCGVALYCAAAYAIETARVLGPMEFLVSAAVCLAAAVILLAVLCSLLPGVAAAVVFSLLPPAGFSLLAREAPFCAGDASSQVFRSLDQGESDDAVSRPRARRGSRALAFAAGFFALCSTAMCPKTAHLPGLGMDAAYLGSLSSYSLLYMVATACCIAALVFVVRLRDKINPTHAAIGVAVVFATTFLLLPYLKETPLVFLLENVLALTALAAVVPALAIASAWAGRGGQDARGGRDARRISGASSAMDAAVMGSAGSANDEKRRGRSAYGTPSSVHAGASQLDSRSLAALGAGAFAADSLALVCLVPLFDKLPFQDQLFIGIAAAGCLGVIIGTLYLGEAFLRIYAPERGLKPQAPASDQTLSDRCARLAALYNLTQRERDVLGLVAEGRNEPYIEKELSVSRATVKTHVSHIYKKTGVSSRQQLLDLIQGMR